MDNPRISVKLLHASSESKAHGAQHVMTKSPAIYDKMCDNLVRVFLSD